MPTPNRDETKVYEPDLDVLEKIINTVGSCTSYCAPATATTRRPRA
ncbi:hypothetical protein [Streptomyces viridochromogenes]|nr:hypothetical protein [Streptomyces viridochromogenes]